MGQLMGASTMQLLYAMMTYLLFILRKNWCKITSLCKGKCENQNAIFEFLIQIWRGLVCDIFGIFNKRCNGRYNSLID
jgi:hypothetical protein